MPVEFKARWLTHFVMLHNPHADDEHNVFHVTIKRNGDCDVPHKITDHLDHTPGYNHVSVGICLEIPPSDWIAEPSDAMPSPPQYQVLVGLCYALLRLYQLQPDDVKKHVEWCPVIDLDALHNDLKYLFYGEPKK